MKKKIYFLALISIFFNPFNLPASAFTLTQITNNSTEDKTPHLNDNGQVVWSNYSAPNTKIYLYDGVSPVKSISQGVHGPSDPRINNNGNVVMRGWDMSTQNPDQEVYFYDGISATQITDNTYGDYMAGINDSDHMVWLAESGYWDVYFYNGSAIENLGDPVLDDHNITLSNNDYMAWNRGKGYDREIYLYDGTTVTRLTNNNFGDVAPSVNDSGQVAWSGGGSFNNDQHLNEIYFYDGVSTIKLTDNLYNDVSARINKNGHIVWQGWDGSDWEIYYYNGSTVARITDNDFNDVNPVIGNNNLIAWLRKDDINSPDRVILYDNGVSLILRKDDNEISHNDSSPAINNKGQVTWAGSDGSDSEIFLYDHSSLKLSPPSGDYVTTQRFDLSLIIKVSDLTVTGVAATLDNSDISGTLSSCLVEGTLISGGKTLRCPGVSGDYLGNGSHTLNVDLSLSNGTHVSDSVTWNVLGNTEP